MLNVKTNVDQTVRGKSAPSQPNRLASVLDAALQRLDAPQGAVAAVQGASALIHGLRAVAFGHVVVPASTQDKEAAVALARALVAHREQPGMARDVARLAQQIFRDDGSVDRALAQTFIGAIDGGEGGLSVPDLRCRLAALNMARTVFIARDHELDARPTKRGSGQREAVIDDLVTRTTMVAKGIATAVAETVDRTARAHPSTVAPAQRVDDAVDISSRR